jgi:hypothetical protein
MAGEDRKDPRGNRLKGYGPRICKVRDKDIGAQLEGKTGITAKGV